MRIATLALAALLLSPAGQAAPPPAPYGMGWGMGAGPAGSRHGADSHFITMMIPHHQGAIAMAELALVRGRHPELRALATRIRDSQTRENALMRSWYRQWFGTDVPGWPADGMGMGTGGMVGSGTSLDALRVAPDFDRAFLDLMIAHHRMGVHMASRAQATTLHAELRDLEQAMVRVQSEEIAQMERWSQDWFGPRGERRR